MPDIWLPPYTRPFRKDTIMSLPQDSAKVNKISASSMDEGFNDAVAGLGMESAPLLLLRLRNELYASREIFADMRETAAQHWEAQS